MDKDNVFDWLGERISEEELGEITDFLHGVFDGEAEYRESAEARINEYATNEAAMMESIQDLKARNYDLLMQTPAEEPPSDGVIENEIADDGEVIHIDDLFEDESEGE